MAGRFASFSFRRPLGWLCLSLALAWMFAPTAQAAGLDSLGGSTKLIPADAAIYGVSFNAGDTVRAIGQSKAWNKLVNMPVVKMGLALYHMQAAMPGTPPAKIQEALSDPETRKIIDFVLNLFADEYFTYADDSLIDLLKVYQEANAARMLAPFYMLMSGNFLGMDGDMQGRAALESLAKNAELLKTPNVIMGFKLKNVDEAKENLAKLEKTLQALLEEVPPLKDSLKRTKVDGNEYLTFSIDAKVVPSWDPIDDAIRQLIDKEEDAKKLTAQLKKLTLTISLGVRENYLLAAIGPSTDALAKLGKGDRLIDRPEFKAVEKFTDRKSLGISYMSKRAMAQLTTSAQDIREMANGVDELLGDAPLTEAQIAKVKKDVRELLKDCEGFLPEPGAQVAVSFVVPQGMESYAFHGTKNRRADATKPLSLLSHVGGDPLFALVGRAKPSVEEYDLMVKWIKKLYGYFEEFGLPSMPESEREKTKEFLAKLLPLAKQADQATRTLLIPALADGQSALVVDGKLASKHFAEPLPATEKPMPMIEPAMVFGVSDAAKLKKAVGEYVDVINGILKAFHEIEPNEIPLLRIPEPTISSVSGGKVYAYPLAEELGVDKQIAPNGGLSEKVAAISFVPKQTERILAKTAPSAGGVLADLDRPRAMAVVCNWAEVVNVITPWVNLAADLILEDTMGGADDAQKKMVTEQVATVLELLKVFKRITSEVYEEGNTTVTHSICEIQDLKE